ncbi:MAG: ribosome small subunit-dependent GTPase, partial [Eubacteriales bacterium]|nr:ribosome small subunit-dependent GTPase [Eubacteriales bacterium]
GFSLLDLEDMDPRELKDFYREFATYADRCRFAGCLHNSEPGCAVHRAAADGEIPAGRLQRYQKLLETLQDRWRRRYD